MYSLVDMLSLAGVLAALFAYLVNTTIWEIHRMKVRREEAKALEMADLRRAKLKHIVWWKIRGHACNEDNYASTAESVLYLREQGVVSSENLIDIFEALLSIDESIGSPGTRRALQNELDSLLDAGGS